MFYLRKRFLSKIVKDSMCLCHSNTADLVIKDNFKNYEIVEKEKKTAMERWRWRKDEQKDRP